MYENCDYFKFHDLTLTYLNIGPCIHFLGPVFTFSSNYCQTASLSTPEGHFSWKSNDFWAVGKCSNIICKVSCWHKKITIELSGTIAGTANKMACKLVRKSPPNLSTPRVLKLQCANFANRVLN